MMVHRSMALMLATIVLISVLAGCSSQSAPAHSNAGPRSQEDDSFEWSWPPVRIVDSEGLVHDIDGQDMEQVPSMVQQLVPGAALQPAQQPRLFGPSNEPPGGTTVGAEVVVTDDGTIFAIAADYVQRSRNGGQSWEQVLEFTSKNVSSSEDHWESRPTAQAWVELIDGGDTQRVYVAWRGLHGCGFWAYTDDDGNSWTLPPRANWPLSCYDTQGPQPFAPGIGSIGGFNVLGAAGVDYVGQRITSASVSGDPLESLAQHSTIIYECEVIRPFLGLKCAASLDAGRTFSRQVLLEDDHLNCAIGSIGEPAAVEGGVAVFPIGLHVQIAQAGLVSVPGQHHCAEVQPSLAVTEDYGASWSIRSLDLSGEFQVEAHPTVAVAPDGMAYLLYRSADDHRVRLLRSHDFFKSWEGPFNVTLPSTVMHSHPTMVAGPNGSLAVAYLGTSTPQRPGAWPGNASSGAQWHLFTALTLDAAVDNPRFWIQQVTPWQDPVSAGPIDDAARTNLGAYITSSLTQEGRLYVGFIDGCTPRNGCAGDPSAALQGFDHQVSVAVLNSGQGLAGPILKSLDLQHPLASHQQEREEWN